MTPNDELTALRSSLANLAAYAADPSASGFKCPWCKSGSYRIRIARDSETIACFAGNCGWSGPRSACGLSEPAKWKDIATAPKDGVSVLCWHRLWDMPKFAFHIGNDEWKLAETMFAVGIQPTHWMPLPEPPAPEPTS